jgi:mono/diheme cytochrome c family protein
VRIIFVIACLVALYAIYHVAAFAIDSYGEKQGASLYQANCASCHGATLAGQPGWQSPPDAKNWPAPPLGAAGHAWMHDDAALFQHVKNGSAVSPMPAFAETLTDNEIWQVFAYMKTHWPEGVRAYQHEGDSYAPLPGDLPADWLYPPACEPGAGPGAATFPQQ